MPFLHSHFKGKAQMPDGKIVEVPGAPGLIQLGPRIPVVIHVPDQFAAELTKQGKPVPPPISGFALIDTGAGSTCIDEEAAKTLGLPVINVVDMSSASHGSHKANVYPTKLQMTGLPVGINTASAIGAPLAKQKLLALIGRDVLSRFILIYNGANGEFTLCI
jgi:predicted aspartyl protease